MSFTRGVMALDADPTRLVVLSELINATDAATLATAIFNLANHNQYTDAEKTLVAELNKFKGEHATGAALETAHPAAAAQDDAWGFVEGTDSVWVIDTDGGTKTWKDTHTTTAPASVDTGLSTSSANAVSNQVISAAMQNRLVYQVYPIPGDGALTSFTVNHTLSNVVSKHVRTRTEEEGVVVGTPRASATSVTVGPFATPPADSTVYELVIAGTVTI